MLQSCVVDACAAATVLLLHGLLPVSFSYTRLAHWISIVACVVRELMHNVPPCGGLSLSLSRLSLLLPGLFSLLLCLLRRPFSIINPSIKGLSTGLFCSAAVAVVRAHAAQLCDVFQACRRHAATPAYTTLHTRMRMRCCRDTCIRMRVPAHLRCALCVCMCVCVCVCGMCFRSGVLVLRALLFLLWLAHRGAVHCSARSGPSLVLAVVLATGIDGPCYVQRAHWCWVHPLTPTSVSVPAPICLRSCGAAVVKENR